MIVWLQRLNCCSCKQTQSQEYSKNIILMEHRTGQSKLFWMYGMTACHIDYMECQVAALDVRYAIDTLQCIVTYTQKSAMCCIAARYLMRICM